jgi:uncharacterized paraquat-inducible protein A
MINNEDNIKLGVEVDSEDKQAADKDYEVCPNCKVANRPDTNVQCCPVCGTLPYEAPDGQ